MHVNGRNAMPTKRFLTKYLSLLLPATENPPPIPRQRGIIFEME
jgi:hypothetical protein